MIMQNVTELAEYKKVKLHYNSLVKMAPIAKDTYYVK